MCHHLPDDDCWNISMPNAQIFATPWWVNLAIIVPIGTYVLMRKRGHSISWSQLFFAALFAVGFGINEAVVVVYLRASVGLLPGFATTLSNSSSTVYQQIQLLHTLPQRFISTEIFREAATMIMLLGVSFAAAKNAKERWIFFLWMFSIWDIFYYIGLWLIIRWPPSLLTQDVLFLIPSPWIAQVWFPVLVSTLIIAGIVLTKKRQR
jgi:hypothetical protein